MGGCKSKEKSECEYLLVFDKIRLEALFMTKHGLCQIKAKEIFTKRNESTASATASNQHKAFEIK